MTFFPPLYHILFFPENSSFIPLLSIGVRARPNLGGRHLFARKSQKNFLKKKSPNVAKKFLPEFWAFFARKFCPKIFSYYINFGHFARKIYFWGAAAPPAPLARTLMLLSHNKRSDSDALLFLPPSFDKRQMAPGSCAAGRIRFINLNQPAGRTKFFCGPHLARGPDFGHA